MVVNLDLSKTQFDADKLYEQASKLGLDLDDFQDYGLDFTGSNCASVPCIEIDKIKNY